MPALTIETQENGAVLVAPAAGPLDPKTAEQFASLEEAMTAISQVLGQPAAGEAGEMEEPGEMEEGEGGEAAPSPTGDSLSPTAPAAMEDDMEQGYNRARKGL